MKYQITLRRTALAVLLTAFCTALPAQDALFQKYEDAKGVSTVFISKAMFRLMPEPGKGQGGVARIAKKLDHLTILECDRPSLIKQIRTEALAAYRSGGYEMVMRTTDNGETTRIYMRRRSGGKTEYALLNEDSDELTIINIVGNLTLQDIKDLNKNGGLKLNM